MEIIKYAISHGIKENPNEVCFRNKDGTSPGKFPYVARKLEEATLFSNRDLAQAYLDTLKFPLENIKIIPVKLFPNGEREIK